MNGNEQHEQMRQAILKQREKNQIEQMGLPYLKAGMSHNAVAVELRRARKRAAVQKSIEQDEKAQQQQTRAARLPRDPTEAAASTIFYALKDGSESARRYAAQLLKHAPDELRRAVMKLADVDSEFKTRRSRKPNGF